jgi:hypothetical protein
MGSVGILKESLNAAKRSARPGLRAAWRVVSFALLGGYVSAGWADGVCKSAGVPLDYVPVSEFASPKCPGYSSDPFEMNAWEVGPAQDGVVACNIPDPRQLGANVASMLPCERVHTDGCERRADGLPNAVTLRTPLSCVKRGLPPDIQLVCTSTFPTFAALGDLPGSGRHGPHRVYWTMVAESSSPTCPPLELPLDRREAFLHQLPTRKNAFIVRRHRGHATESTPICAHHYNYDGGSDLVVKRFANANCPPAPSSVAGANDGLNAWVITPLSALPEGYVVGCAVGVGDDDPEVRASRRPSVRSPNNAPAATPAAASTKRDVRTPVPQSRDGAAGQPSLSKIPQGPPPSPGLQYVSGYRLPTRHQPQCGGPAGQPNAFRLEIRRDNFARGYIKAFD